MTHHFTLEERVILHELLKKETPKEKIAEIMQRHISTIYRESRTVGYRGKRFITGLDRITVSGVGCCGFAGDGDERIDADN
jgi:hypothetical protein